MESSVLLCLSASCLHLVPIPIVVTLDLDFQEATTEF